MHYPVRLIADTFVMIARCGILLVLYWYVFKLNGGIINGVTYQLVAWSMFFYFAFSTWRLREIARLIMFDVQSGAVETLFNKPISYLRYRLWWQVGAGLYPFVVITVLGSIALAFIVGIPETMTIALFLPTVFLVFLGAAFLSLMLYSIVGLLSFWIEDINPVFWIVDKAVMILGGSYLPVALFPDFMYKLALYSPFGASQFITHTVYNSWKSEWPLLIGIQIFWILICTVIVFFMFKKARKKIFVNGG